MKKSGFGDVMATQVLSTIPRQSYDPAMQLPGGFTLADLTITNTGIDNSPENDQILQNITETADRLAWIRSNIGDFTLYSAYRNPEVNAKVGGAAGSLHAHGKAADIAPTTMSLVDMFSKLIQPGVAEQFGEIAIKPSQGTIHISTPDPKVGTAKIMKMTPEGKYFRLTQNELDQYRGGSTPQEAATEEVAYEEDSDDTIQDTREAGISWWIPLALVAGFATIWFNKRNT